MKYLLMALGVAGACLCMAQPDTTQETIAGRRNSPEQQQKPYVIMISADGFRYDYADKHNAVYLQALRNSGVEAEYMLPSYPSLTFPNHYTLATGLYPAHHGLVGNSFYDAAYNETYALGKADKVTAGKWYGGTPLWVLAEQQQMLTASFYWVGSEAPVQGILPTYYYHYNEALPMNRRIQVVVDWLQLPAERRPHLITFYFPEVDHAGHHFGPEAPETGRAVRLVDTAVYQLTEAVKTTGLEVSFILVSDHGMTRINTEKWLTAPQIDTTKALMTGSGELFEIYLKARSDIKPLYQKLKAEAKGYSVRLKTDMPRHLHYSNKDDIKNRIGDILLIPDWPYVFRGFSKPAPGAHGFNPYLVPDMRATFYAWGPAFQNKKIAAFQNVDVYPVITKLLGLTYTNKIDGSVKLAKKILNEAYLNRGIEK